MQQGKYNTNVSIKLLSRAITEGWIRPLALFHLIKFSFGNSVVFDYKTRMPELARRFQISTKTLYSYLDVLRSKGLIIPFENAPGNLHLISIQSIKKELSDRKKTVITISDTDSLFDIVCRLYAKKIEKHLRHMAFMKSIQGYGRRNLHKLNVGEGAPVPLFSLSTRNTAKLLNINEKTAIKVLKTLEGLNILRLHPTKATRLTPNKLPVKLLSEYPGYHFVTKNGTFIQFGNRLELLQYPVKILKITLKRYLTYFKSTQCKKYHNY